MRRLYLVPVVHASPEMGFTVPALEEMARETMRKGLWQQHQEVIARFWETTVSFFERLNVEGFLVYQDGLAQDDEAGLKAVLQAAREGSRNHEVIVGLLKRGAVLVGTEDISLVKQEYAYITRITTAESPRELEVSALRYRLAQERLLAQRDSCIVRRIDETLKEGGSGIIFIGAYHNVHTRLPGDIRIIQVKEVARARGYHRALLNWEREPKVFQELAQYLASPVLDISNS